MNLNRRFNFPRFHNRCSGSWVFLGHQIFEEQGMRNTAMCLGVIVLLVEKSSFVDRQVPRNGIRRMWVEQKPREVVGPPPLELFRTHCNG